MPFPVHHPSLPYDTLSPSTKYSGDSHKGWLLQLVDIMVGWACTVPTRKRADRRGSVQSIIACTERAALHRAIPLPRPFNPSLSQPEYRPPSPLHPSSFAGPNPLPLSIKCSKPVLATTTTRPSPTPPPLRPRRNYKHSFHTKSRWRCPATLSRNEPRASRIFATDCHSSTICPSPNHHVLARSNPFPNSRDYRGRR